MTDRQVDGSFPFEVEAASEPFENELFNLNQLYSTWIPNANYTYLYLADKIVPFGKTLKLKCTDMGAIKGDADFVNDPDNLDQGGINLGNGNSDKMDVEIEVNDFVEERLKGIGLTYEYDIEQQIKNEFFNIVTEGLNIAPKGCDDYPWVYSEQMRPAVYPIKAKYYIPAFDTYTLQDGLLTLTIKDAVEN